MIIVSLNPNFSSTVSGNLPHNTLVFKRSLGGAKILNLKAFRQQNNQNYLLSTFAFGFLS